MKALLLAVCLVVVGCGRKQPTEPDGPRPPDPTYRFVVVSGADQTVRAVVQRPDPLYVRLVRANGVAVPEVAVRFDLIRGSAQLTSPRLTTDPYGYVRNDITPLALMDTILVRATAELPESTRTTFRLIIQ